MKKHTTAVLAIAGLICGAVFGGQQAKAEVTWTAYTFGPSETLGSVKALRQIIDTIEKETNGELKMQLHLGGSLPIKSTNITQAMGEGITQFGDDGFFLGNVPIAGIMRLPMLLSNKEEFNKAQKVMQPYIKRAFEKQGVVVLGYYTFPFQVAWSTKKLTTLNDFKGQKMRVSSPEQAAFVERFGGAAITLGGAEVPQALQRHTVDGVFTASAGGGKIWGDMLSYNYRLGVNYFNTVYLVNKEAFDQLSPALQKTVREVTDRLAPNATELMLNEEDAVTDKLKAAGMVVTMPSAEEVKTATARMAPYWDEWAKERGPEAIEALAKVRAALGR
jgi:TRAP-type transport system periplasmic protein